MVTRDDLLIQYGKDVQCKLDKAMFVIDACLRDNCIDIVEGASICIKREEYIEGFFGYMLGVAKTYGDFVVCYEEGDNEFTMRLKEVE